MDNKFEYSSNYINGFSAYVKGNELVIVQDTVEEEYPHNRVFDEWKYDITDIDDVITLDTFTQNKFKELNG